MRPGSFLRNRKSMPYDCNSVTSTCPPLSKTSRIHLSNSILTDANSREFETVHSTRLAWMEKLGACCKNFCNSSGTFKETPFPSETFKITLGDFFRPSIRSIECSAFMESLNSICDQIPLILPPRSSCAIGRDLRAKERLYSFGRLSAS